METVTSSASRRVALTLGSGGARGYAHIGVIDELTARGYEIVGISGSSMGALVGGLQAAGRLHEFADWAQSLTQGAVLRLLDPTFTAAGVLRAGKILDVVHEIVGDVNIEELPIPYTAVTTDLISGRSVWLQRGPLHEAIRASIAIPGVISPHVVEGRLLADGGILDPVPMGPIAAVNADLTVAVNLSGADAADVLAPEDCEDTDEEASHGSTPAWLTRMLQSTSALMDRSAARALFGRFGNDDTEPDGETEPQPEVPKLGSFEVMNRTIDIAQAALTRHHLATHPPDLLIEVPRTACRSLDFHCATEIIDIGRKLAGQALESDRPV